MDTNFSYLDTQLKPLGCPNFTQLPINAPKYPFANMQRDGRMHMGLQPRRVTYTPSLLDPKGRRESHDTGYRSFAAPLDEPKVRARSATFVEPLIVRAAMPGHLVNIDPKLGERVAQGLGHEAPIVPAKAVVPTREDLKASPKLSILAGGPPPLKGRKIGLLVTDGADAPKLGGVTLADGSKLAAHHQLAGGPSVLFDTVAIVTSADGAAMLAAEAGCGRGRVGPRCVPASEGDRPHPTGAAAARQGRRGAG